MPRIRALRSNAGIPRLRILAAVSLAPLAFIAALSAQPTDEARWTPVGRMARDIEQRGIEARVPQNRYWRDTLIAIVSTDREKFVPKEQAPHAYESKALPIGFDRTLSDPFTIALATSLLRLDKSSRVLEISTGSGYQTAVLAHGASEVWTIEKIPELARAAETAFVDQGYHNIHVLSSEGYDGWRDAAPFDAIIVTAGAPKIPELLIDQLKPGGRMVVPIARVSQGEEWVVITKGRNGKSKQESFGQMFANVTDKR